MAIQASLGIGISSNSTSVRLRTPEELRDARVTVALEGSGTFTVNIEVSLDGDFWYSLATKTASEIFTIALAPYYQAVFTDMAGAYVTINLDFSPKLHQNPL